MGEPTGGAEGDEDGRLQLLAAGAFIPEDRGAPSWMPWEGEAGAGILEGVAWGEGKLGARCS